jgi:hypothetical protein
MGEVALNVTLFHFFMLDTIIALYAFFSPLDVLASPPIDRQEIQNSNGWVQIPLPQFSDVNIMMVENFILIQQQTYRNVKVAGC